MTKTFITTALAAIAVLAVVPAAHATPSQTGTFTVSTAGLDLRNPVGAQIMLHRIETAAGAVCGEAPYAGDLDATHDYKACVSYNVGQAVAQLGSPLVADAGHQPKVTWTASNGR
jgi:UrcA family protein